jgi:uncharacterized protein (DUF2062 family)
MSGIFSRIAAWAYRAMPSREQLEAVPLVRPLARRPELWLFTRRSVPRGVAIGLLVGIFALIPGIQIAGAALLCVPSRGNIPIAAAMTFLSNPATTPLILAGSIYVGNKVGYHADLTTLYNLFDRGAGMSEWGYWLLSDAAPALLIGLFMISTVVAALGYLLSSWIWRAWVGRKVRARQRRYMEREGELL